MRAIAARARRAVPPRALGALAALLWLGAGSTAHAIRPFVTDDARVVGEATAQLESWLLLDRSVLEHNAFVAFGPHRRLELTLGLVHGAVHSGLQRGYSLTGPIAQAKWLLLEAVDNGRPGVALSGGVLPPFGHGPMTPVGFGGFGFVAVTQSLWQERWLLHANLGFTLGDDGPQSAQIGFATPRGTRLRSMLTGGVATQFRLVGDLHALAEVYHADPYDPRTDFWGAQVGARYILSEQVQFDASFGCTLDKVASPGVTARREPWGSLGVRVVTPKLF